MSFYSSADNLDDLMFDGIEALLESGAAIATSRGETKELRGVTLELVDPRARMSRSANRGRLFSALGEFAWYLAGDDKLEAIEYYISSYGKNVEALTGAYGPRLFGVGDQAQIERVISQLRRRSSSRQAIVQLFRLEDLSLNRKDVPCTSTLQFFDRDGHIDLIVYMRSNDVIYGLPHDVFAFTMLQEIVARSLGREIGTYVHMVGSLHIYTKDEQLAQSFLREGALARVPMPPMPGGDPWPAIDRFRTRERVLRTEASLTDLESEPEEYWRDLTEVLAAWRAFKKRDSEALLGARDRLAETFYGLYLSDKHFEMEERDRAQ